MLWIVSDVISEGMQGEIEEARKLGIPVRRVEIGDSEVIRDFAKKIGHSPIFLLLYLIRLC